MRDVLDLGEVCWGMMGPNAALAGNEPGEIDEGRPWHTRQPRQ
jgi:hypothetical protein